MSILPTSFRNQGIFDKLIGGAIGALYGSKTGNWADGLIGGYIGAKNPSTLYDRLVGNYIPTQNTLNVNQTNNEERGF